MKMIVVVISLMFYGCSSRLLESNYHEARPISPMSRVMTGEQVARDLTAQYNDTRQDCGTQNRPAFLCSGILFRATTPSTDYHAWDPSPSSITRGGVSFAYMRNDAKLYGMHSRYNNGFIFTPYLLAAADATKPEVLCAFPYDGNTGGRIGVGGCGAHPAYPLDSQSCQSQQITAAQSWYAHFTSVGAPPTEWSSTHASHECGFDLRDVPGAQNAAPFYQVLTAVSLIPNSLRQVTNELILATWPQGIPDKLPLEAFFYTDGGLSNAQYVQRDYYSVTNKYLPIIYVVFPETQTGTASFTFRDQDQVVRPDEGIANLTPRAPQASGNSGQLLRIDDYYRLDSVTIQVPQYPGMSAGQTVGIKWAGAVMYNSEIKTVTTPGQLSFEVPRVEVIDSIGRAVPITFSVKRGSNPIEISAPLNLQVEAQALTLPAPIINVDRTAVAVEPYQGMAIGHTVRVRWVG
ncbi:hypothetical protein, partial [Burkholderia ubonensis]|uniref:hypothetical protein n=1 Tax=Burkholderia ubonensis TaxID=101571 RepID=UPI000A97DE83